MTSRAIIHVTSKPLNFANLKTIKFRLFTSEPSFIDRELRTEEPELQSPVKDTLSMPNVGYLRSAVSPELNVISFDVVTSIIKNQKEDVVAFSLHTCRARDGEFYHLDDGGAAYFSRILLIVFTDLFRK